jgi:hypothetical protein
MTFCKKLPRVSDGFEIFDVASDQLSAQPYKLCLVFSLTLHVEYVVYALFSRIALVKKNLP